MEGDRASPVSHVQGESSQETGYIPIRILGRGAFGEAVLYRKFEDNSLVVWKEVALNRLGDKERREAQNEIDILSILNHSNIVSYYNHFLDGDTLLIEMEYANGGNLYEKIAAQEELFEEKMVLWYFYQIMSGLSHIHEYGILHRDVKTLNIFLNKSGLVKLGDFGISRVLDSSADMAESYVGTPYYMSPELIRGEKYNQKSDIWAAGCVLYEFLTLTRVFDATNTLKLAYEIVHNDIEDISPTYTENLKQLVRDMLNKDPSARPTCEDILKGPLFGEDSSEHEEKIWELNSATRRAKLSSSASTQDILPVVTSKSSEVYIWGGGKLTPQNLDLFTKGRSALQVSVGRSHFAVVTVEKELYTWANTQGGSEIVGQLGHGDAAAYKAPKKVAFFEEIPVAQVSCGEDFTLCVTGEGKLYAFGSDYYGCLGCDNQEGDEVTVPNLLPFFSATPVDQVSCGDTHVLVLTRDGEVYSWGCGEFGRLGLGSEDDHSTPQKVQTRGRHGIKSVHAGPDGSFLLKTNGRVLACGSNEHNKLGFNSSAHGLKRKDQISYDIPCKCTFSTVKPLSKYNVVSVATGRTHSAVLDSFGLMLTFGSNRYGQLGVGDFKEHNGVHRISGPLVGKSVTVVACGDGFTVAATQDNHIYSWGLADNGRLGTKSTDTRKGPGGSCSTLPRPIFGALHIVSGASTKHWNTIIIAEKVLAQKTIRSTSVLSQKDDTETDPFEFHTEYLEENFGSAKNTDQRQAEESIVPNWLKAELEDSEFISANSEENSCVSDLPATSSVDPSESSSSGQESRVGETQGDTIPPWLSQELADSEVNPAGSNPSPVQSVEALKVEESLTSDKDTVDSTPTVSVDMIKSLESKVQNLSTENQKLEELVYQQAETIRTQAVTIAHLEDKSRYYEDVHEEIWDLVEIWRQDWLAAMGTRTMPPEDNVCQGDNNNVILPPRPNLVMSQSDFGTSLDSASDRSDGATSSLSNMHGSHSDSDLLLHWDNLGSPDETRTWSKSGRPDMLKSYLPGHIMQQLKGVTTTEEIL